MAAPPARARADYDYLIKLLLIGDSGECPLDLSLPVDQEWDRWTGWGRRVADLARPGRAGIRMIDAGSVWS
jgi:hypothetical protein